jgi:hypothetical protein
MKNTFQLKIGISLKNLIFIILLLSLNQSIIPQKKLNYKTESTKSYFTYFFNVKFPDKDEYETYEQFFSRVKIPQINQDKEFSFLIPSTTTSYDPYDSMLTISSGFFERQKYPYYKLLLLEDIKKIRTYTATNGFGNKTKVTEYEKSNYYLDSLNLEYIKLDGDTCESCLSKFEYDDKYYNTINIELKLPPQKAKNLSKKLKSVIIIKIASYFNRDVDFDYIEPEFTNPIELTKKDFFIHGKIVKIIIYNTSNSEIIKEIFFH